MANELKKALLAAKMDPAWPKLTKNKEGHFKYADLYHILGLVEPALGRHGLVVNFEPKERHDIEVMITVLSHPESNTESTAESMIRPGKDDKSWGGSCTYQKRYGLLAILGIAVSDDYDPDGAIKLSPEQIASLQNAIKAHGPKRSEVYAAVLEVGKVATIEDIYQDDFDQALKFITNFKGR